MRRRVVVAAAATVALAGAGAIAEGSDPDRRSDEATHVVVRGTGGGAVAALRLPVSRAFSLAYRHSYHRRPAVERFRALRGGAGFELVAISSPSGGVLDYYEVEGTRRRAGGWWTLRLARPVRFRELALAATAVGRRTLVAGSRRIPLYGRDGGTRHLTIAVEGS